MATLKRTNQLLVTLLPSLLEASSEAMPNGAIHVAVQRELVEVDDGNGAETIYVREGAAGERHVIRADLLERARELYRDIAQSIADDDAVPVKASVKAGAVLVQPSSRG